MKSDIQSIVDKYRVIRPLYDGFAHKMASLIRDVLEANNIKYQMVESRAKDISSFEEKISRPGKSYRDPIKDITDLCGCRVIVYYQDDVDRVAEVIKKEFRISEENLSRQPQLLEVDRFGYLSAHYVVLIGKGRIDLTEWKPYVDLVAEIQVRTVIQHAWSAVSHALQYKQEASIPSKLQRRLHRIAGLFELADEEFVGLRKEREGLQLQARHDVEAGDDRVPLTAATVSEFIATWEGVDVLLDLAEQIGFSRKNDSRKMRELTADIYDTAVLGGISDLGGLRKALEQPAAEYLERLWDDSKADGSERWVVTGPFVVLLMLIYNARDRITVGFLTARGFDQSIARRVIKDCAVESNKNSKRTRKASTK